MNEAKLSIIVPIFNEEKSLETNINILLQTLDTFYTDYEIILSEDGSTDNTKSICEKLAEHDKIRTIDLSRYYVFEFLWGFLVFCLVFVRGLLFLLFSG